MHIWWHVHCPCIIHAYYSDTIIISCKETHVLWVYNNITITSLTESLRIPWWQGSSWAFTSLLGRETDFLPGWRRWGWNCGRGWRLFCHFLCQREQLHVSSCDSVGINLSCRFLYCNLNTTVLFYIEYL